MDKYIIDQIKQIVRDCEDYCQTNASTYSKEHEMLHAYVQIVETLKSDSTEDDLK